MVLQLVIVCVGGVAGWRRSTTATRRSSGAATHLQVHRRICRRDNGGACGIVAIRWRRKGDFPLV